VLNNSMVYTTPLSLPSPVEGEGVGFRDDAKRRLNYGIWLTVVIATIFFAKIVFAQQLDTLNVSYASVTGSRIPLWIAKDAGLFEKYGLNVNLVIIAAGNAAIGALANGDVEILGAPGSTTMVSAAKGLPFAIIGTFGPSAWKLAAHPSITTVEQLRGKTIGISRPGTTIEFATKRALQLLGFTPGKDVNILATGLAESNKRIMVMLQGKMDATLVSPDNLYEAEIRGWKLSIIADLKELGIVTSASDLSAKRDFIRNQRQKARAFMMAYCEGIWFGKANKATAIASFRKHMRENDTRRLEALHKNYIVDYLPPKPFPMEDAIQADIENLTPTVPEFRGKKVADFIDKSILADLEREGFFTQLASKYGKQQ